MKMPNGRHVEYGVDFGQWAFLLNIERGRYYVELVFL